MILEPKKSAVRGIALAGVFFVAACAGGNYFEVKPLPKVTPAKNIVVVYTHGSVAARTPDNCVLYQNRPGSGTPPIIENLEGAPVGGKSIRIHKFCTPSRTGQPLHGLGDDLGPSKVMQRTFDLVNLSKAYRQAGFSADQIVFAGQSAGGFASMLAQSISPASIGRVIAFGPAFANKRAVRNAGEKRANVRLKATLAKAKDLNALVYSYDQDVYERPQDLTGWPDNPGIRIYAVKGLTIEGQSCNTTYAHHLAFEECFERTQRERILSFIENGN